MHKKIRAREYRNKAAFARDLTLIWENCLKYNADVSYRGHVASGLEDQRDGTIDPLTIGPSFPATPGPKSRSIHATTR